MGLNHMCIPVPPRTQKIKAGTASDIICYRLGANYILPVPAMWGIPRVHKEPPILKSAIKKKVAVRALNDFSYPLLYWLPQPFYLQ